MTEFPSHHGGFLGGEHGYAGQPEAFAARLREVLDEQGELAELRERAAGGDHDAVDQLVELVAEQGDTAETDRRPLPLSTRPTARSRAGSMGRQWSSGGNGRRGHRL